MKARLFAAMAALFLFLPLSAQVTAAFTADEAATTYYQQGWDSTGEFSTWTYVNNSGFGKSTWGLAEKPSFSGSSAPRPFSSIDESSTHSLAILYDNARKDESAVSPAIEIRENSTVEYYLCLFAVWYVNADLKFYITDIATGEETLLLSTFLWAQENAYTGPNWEKFTFDLAPYAGKTCRFSFRYAGAGGENVFIDGFRVRQRASATDAQVHIFEGEKVHFLDESTGNPSLWSWEFEGGQPATSVSKNPVVTYPVAGTYRVKLTARKDGDISTAVRESFVHVSAKSPTAFIGTPVEGYLSPYAYCFLPTGVPVQYRDLSTGSPTEWSWTFEGATPATSVDQHPVVTYPEQGTFGVTLDVSNAAGASQDFLSSVSVQAGGEQEVWNILPEETTSDDFGAVYMSFYGYYAGSNWLGIDRFAERYHAPAADAEVSGVNVYFYSTTTVSPDAPVTVSLCTVGDDGMPAAELAAASLPASQLAYDAEYVVPTAFTFDHPVAVDQPFFVVISGIPNATDGQGQSDAISIFCIRRGEGGTATTCHHLEEWDANDQPTGNYLWYQSDEPVSMAVAPKLRYVNTTAIDAAPAVVDRRSADTDWYTLQGVRQSRPAASGIYIRNGRKTVVNHR